MLALMFMFAIQKHPSLQIIDQKFLVPGHTHLECDSDHAKIKRYKKQSDSIIAIPMDWYNFVRSVRGKVPLKVVEMEQEHFKSFSSFFSGPLVKRNVDVNKEKINWLMIKWLRYDKQFSIVQFKYLLDEDTPFRSLDLRKGTIKTRFRAELTSGASNLNLPNTYNDPLPIEVEKKKDLISILPLIDPIYHPFYNSLKTKTITEVTPDSETETE